MVNNKISIIIPTYNRAWSIENAIKSVISQNYDNWELFIIDDWSIDKTSEIVKKYENDKVKYFYKEHSWKLPSVNYWIDNLISKDSSLLFILDSDDEFILWILQDVNNEFNENPDIVSFHYKAKFPKHINRKSKLIWKKKDFIIADYEKLLKGETHVWEFPWFINLKMIWDIRFEEISVNFMENIFWYRIARKWNAKFINKEFLFLDSSRKRFDEKDNLTSYAHIFERAKLMIDWFDILLDENRFDAMNFSKNILSKWYLEQFQWCIIDRQLKKWFNSWKESLKYWDFKMKIKVFLLWFLFLTPKVLLPLVSRIFYN